MTYFIIPGIVFIILIYGMYQKVEIYDVFLEGVKEGIKMVLKIFPTMFAMVLSVDVLVKSNFIQDVTTLFRPILDFLHFPEELLSLAIMRPISGSSSLVLMNDILRSYSPDSYLGRVASVIQGSSDTTIYILSLYFSSVGIKRIKYSLVVGLLSDLCALILSIIVIQMLF